MVYFTIKEIKYNFSQFLIYSVILAVLFSITGVMAFYCKQINSNYYGPLKDSDGFSLKIDSDLDLSEFDNKNIYIYSTQESMTYNIFLKAEEQDVFIYDYSGGVAINISTSFSQILDKLIIQGNGFVNKKECIWLSKDIATLLNVKVGDSLQIVSEDKQDKNYIVYGIYNSIMWHELFDSTPSFVIAINSVEFETFIAITHELQNLKFLFQNIPSEYIIDENGFSDYLQGLEILKIMFKVIVVFLSLGTVIALMLMFYTYIQQNEDFNFKLQYIGLRKINQISYIGGIFSILVMIASSLSCVLAFAFDRIIRYWSVSILSVEFASIPILQIFAFTLILSIILVWIVALIKLIISININREINI